MKASDPHLLPIVDALADGEIVKAAALFESAGRALADSPAGDELLGLIECQRGAVRQGHRRIVRACHRHRARVAATWPPFSGVDVSAYRETVTRLATAYARSEESAPAGAANRRSNLIARRGQLLEVLGRADDALAAAAEARRLQPGWASPETDRSRILLRRGGLAPASPRAADAVAAGRISKIDIGGTGRFGNQVLQYMYLHAYARRFGLVAEVPDWIGRYLFTLDDPYPARPWPRLGQWLGVADDARAEATANMALMGASLAGTGADMPAAADDMRRALADGGHWPPRDFDTEGFFVLDSAVLKRDRGFLTGLFRFAPPFEAIASSAMARLRDGGRTVVAVHVRSGDRADALVGLAAVCRDWLAGLWPTLDRPVLYLASDDPERAKPAFESYGPVIGGEIAHTVPGAEFFLDYAVLMNADILAISQSTFSATAAMLNRTGTRTFRPDGDGAAMVAFDPWSGPTYDPRWVDPR